MVANIVAKELEKNCVYTTVKIDRDVIPVVKAAAALAGKPVQEYVSDVTNAFASKAIGRKPVQRLPASPRKR